MESVSHRSFVRLGLTATLLPLVPNANAVAAPNDKKTDPAATAVIHEMLRQVRRLKKDGQVAPDDLRAFAGQLRVADAVGERLGWQRAMRELSMRTLAEADAAVHGHANKLAPRLTTLGLPTTADEIEARYWRARSRATPEHVDLVQRRLDHGAALNGSALVFETIANRMERDRADVEAQPVGIGHGPCVLDAASAPQDFIVMAYWGELADKIYSDPDWGLALIALQAAAMAILATITGMTELALIMGLIAFIIDFFLFITAPVPVAL